MIHPTPHTPRPRRLAVIAAATVALGAAGLHASTARAAPPAPIGPSCLPIACAADYMGMPVEHLIVEVDEDARTSGAAPIDVLVARIDAVAAVRLAVAGRTDGPVQVAAMRYLLDQHDRVRFAVVVGAGDPPPVLVGVER